MGKKYGQHFLYDTVILEKIVDASGVTQDDTVVEIGPGRGSLTRILLERAKRVVAVEIDPTLFVRLKEAFAGYLNLTLVNADALDFDFASLEPFKVVSNIPYGITTPLIFRLFETCRAPASQNLDSRNLDSMTLTVQKEVALRIAAPPGGKDYGALTVAVRYHSIPRLEFFIPAGAFRPPPKVDSCVVRFDVLKTPPVRVKDERMFFRLVRAVFSKRRKTLLNGLKGFSSEPAEALRAAGIDPQRRAETLDLAEFARLADAVSGLMTRHCQKC
jgi:16S rRNA (adenine1518-N6/adenine1519-N6)-dimethyltransferase